MGNELNMDSIAMLGQIFKPDVVSILKQKLSGDTAPAVIVDTVQPGDLITADLINQTILSIVDLQKRMARLESGELPSASQVRISSIAPSGALHVGDEVTIEGENFEFSLGGSSVTFGSESVSAFKPGSREGRLIVDVPDLRTKLPDGGSQVLVAVSNRNSTDYRSVVVMPPQVILYGSVLVTPDAVKPDPPEAGKEVLFGYKVTSAASTKAEFPIKVLLSETGKPLDSQLYDHLVSVLGPDKKTALPDRTISLEPGSPTFLYVRLKDLPFPDASSFDIMVTLSTGGVKGDSMIKSYTVGQENSDDSYLALELISYDHADWVADGVADIPAKRALIPSMTLRLTDAAVKANLLKADCDISLTLTEGSGWTLALLDPIPETGKPTIGKSTLTVGGDNKTPVPATLRFAIAAQPNPSASARFELTVTRAGQTEKMKKTGLTLSTPVVP